MRRTRAPRCCAPGGDCVVRARSMSAMTIPTRTCSHWTGRTICWAFASARAAARALIMRCGARAKSTGCSRSSPPRPAGFSGPHEQPARAGRAQAASRVAADLHSAALSAAPGKDQNVNMDETALLPIEDHHGLLSPQRWKRRAALWSGAILVALAAIVFARGSDLCYGLFKQLLAQSRWWPLLVTPLGFAVLAWLTAGALRGTRGSGIPQVIAALSREHDASFRERLLALPVAAGKLVLTLFAMLVGASVGREGPTVHVGAGLMAWLAQRFGFRDAASISRFALAGGAAGIAAAFNTPLAGVMFAIEELAGAYEHRFSGALLTAVMVGGVVSLGLVGDYAYFGKMSTSLPLGESWIAVLATGVVGGLAGGLFARTILLAGTGLAGLLGRFQRASPPAFAAACGLLLALIGLASGDAVYGTGYEQAREIIAGTHTVTLWFGLDKWLANAVSYAAGIPGGIFSPAL